MSLFDWFADRRKGQSVVKVAQEPEEGDGLNEEQETDVPLQIIEPLSNTTNS